MWITSFVGKKINCFYCNEPALISSIHYQYCHCGKTIIQVSEDLNFFLIRIYSDINCIIGVTEKSFTIKYIKYSSVQFVKTRSYSSLEDIMNQSKTFIENIELLG